MDLQPLLRMVSSKLPTSVVITHLAARPSTTATKASSCGATATGPAQRKGNGVDPFPPAGRYPVQTLLSFRTLQMEHLDDEGSTSWNAVVTYSCLPGFTAGNGRTQ